MIERDALNELINYCNHKKVSLISDEIYHGIQYEMKPATALEFSDSTVLSIHSRNLFDDGLEDRLDSRSQRACEDS